MKKGKLKKIVSTTAIGVCALTMPFAMTGCTQTKDINVRFEDSYFQWQVDGSSEWNNVISLDEIKDLLGEGYQGNPGIDGREVEFQKTSTHIQWRYITDDDSDEWKNLVALDDIKGAPAENGQTPYIGQNGNWWIGQTDTGVKAEGKDGEDGISIINTVAEFKYDSKEHKEYIELTITYSNGYKEVTRMEIPRTVESIEYVGSNIVLKYDESKAPAMKIKATYDDGSIAYVDVTDDMFVESDYSHYDGNIYRKVDFNNCAEDVKFKIYYMGKTCTGEISIVDYMPIESISYDKNLIMFVKDGQIVENLSKEKNVLVTYVTGQSESISLNDPDIVIDYSNFTEVGTPFEAIVTYRGAQGGGFVINVLPVEETNFVAQSVSVTTRTIHCEVNQNFSEQNIEIALKYYYEGECFEYFTVLTEDMILDYDNSIEAYDKRYYLDSSKLFGANVDNTYVTITNYSTTTTPRNVYLSYINATSYIISPYNLIRQVRINDIDDLSDFILKVDCNNGKSYNIPLNESMLENYTEIDFSKPGVYNLGKITYNGFQNNSEVVFELYDPQLQNVYYIASYYSTNTLKVTYNNGSTNIEEVLAKYVIGEELKISYFDKNYMAYEDSVKITRDMIDISEVDFNYLGGATAKIRYMGRECSLYINIIPDTSNVIATYTKDPNIENFFFQNCSGVKVYDSGVAEFINSNYGYYLICDLEALEDGILKLYEKLSFQAQMIFKIEDGVVYDMELEDTKQDVFVRRETSGTNVLEFIFNVYADQTYTGKGVYYSYIELILDGQPYLTEEQKVCVELEIDKENAIIKTGFSTYKILEDNKLEKIS